MKRIVFGLMALCLVGSSFASKATQNERQKAIDNAILNRISVQNDFWFDDGDYPRIIQLHRFAYEFAPSDYELATNLGWMYGNLQMHAEELAIYTRFRRENQLTLADATFPEANFYFFRKAYAKVPPLLEGSLKLKPHPNTYRILAHSYDRMGMMKDCVRVWSAYVKVYPQDPKGPVNLKRAEEKLNKSGKKA